MAGRLDVGVSRLGVQGQPVFLFKILRQLEQCAAATFEVAVGGALITAQHFAAVGIAQGAGFDIEEDLDLPGLKGIAGQAAARDERPPHGLRYGPDLAAEDPERPPSDRLGEPRPREAPRARLAAEPPRGDERLEPQPLERVEDVVLGEAVPRGRLRRCLMDDQLFPLVDLLRRGEASVEEAAAGYVSRKQPPAAMTIGATMASIGG